MMIKIYTTPSCIYCKVAKEFFKKKNLEFTEVNVVQDQKTLDDFVKLTGKRSVPVFEINGELILGYDEDVLRQKIGIIV